MVTLKLKEKTYKKLIETLENYIADLEYDGWNNQDEKDLLNALKGQKNNENTALNYFKEKKEKKDEK